MSSHPDVTRFIPADEFNGIDDPMPSDNNDDGRTSDNTECDCPFPWWWIVLAGIAGGGVGYAVGKRKKDTEELELEP